MKKFEHMDNGNCVYCNKPIRPSQKEKANNGKPVHIKCKVKYDMAFS